MRGAVWVETALGYHVTTKTKIIRKRIHDDDDDVATFYEITSPISDAPCSEII